MNTPRIIREEGIFERGTHYRLFVPYNWIERQSFVRLRLVWWLIKLAWQEGQEAAGRGE